jgi:hypothetical protein
MEPAKTKINLAEEDIIPASQDERVYFKLGFCEAINILKAVVEGELHTNHHVNKLAKETITSIIVTMEEALGEIDAYIREAPKQ